MLRRPLLLIVLVVTALTSCEDKRFQTYMANVPIYLTYDDLRSSFDVISDQPLEQPGKIYFKDGFMYINEYQKGIHVLDLTDPAHPDQVAFINIPGNVDMAITDNILYADSYVDLVLIDISDPASPTEVKRVEDIFEYVIPPYDYDYPLDEIDEKKGVITGYKIEKITREVQIPVYPWPIYYDYALMAESSVKYDGGSNAARSYGIGGSMARFLTYDDYLYTLQSNYMLKTINIEDLNNPVEGEEKYLWGNVETMFISGEYMYVGSSNGMHILSLQEPSMPILLSTYQHITSCDPVVVSGNRAFVTLRAGNFCGGDQNLLDIINISDKYEPKRISSYPMTEPYGLGIDGNTLFICEGEYGLKVYDATNSTNIQKIAEFSDITATDVIPLSSFLFMIGDDGFYIYDYSDLNDINLLSSIPVIKTE